MRKLSKVLIVEEGSCGDPFYGIFRGTSFVGGRAKAKVTYSLGEGKNNNASKGNLASC